MFDKSDNMADERGDDIIGVDALLDELADATHRYDRQTLEKIIRSISRHDGQGCLGADSLLNRSNVKRQLASTMHAAIVNRDLRTVMLIHRCGMKVRAMELSMLKENGSRLNARMINLLEILLRNQITRMPRPPILRQKQLG